MKVRHKIAPAASAALVVFAAAADAAELDGRWALLQSTTTVADVPVVGEIYATTVAVSVHDLTASEGRLRGGGTLCRLAIDSGTALVRTIVPPALLRAIPPPRVDARLERRGGKLVFWQTSPPIVLGARLAAPSDPLPTSASDPRVFDADGDGAPGVTIRIEGIASGDMHLVQRSWARLDGALLVDRTFGGRIRHGLSQSVLEATSPFLRDPPRSRPWVEGSYFRMGRLEAGAGCAEANRSARAWMQ